MFFDDLSQLFSLAKKSHFTIFVLPANFDEQLIQAQFPAKNSFFLQPDPKTGKISVEAVREFTSLATNKQTANQFFIVTSADTLNEAGENAFLKNLEEPGAHHFFIFFTSNLSALLPTVLSRANIYILRSKNALSAPVQASSEIKTLAKQLITVRSAELLRLATKITTKKDRNFALEIVATAIEMLYKSFFLTKNPKLLPRLQKLLKLYDNLTAGGHIKLHLVADLC